MKVMSYNIWEGGEDRLPLIAAVIRRQEPDVVALLEACDPGRAERLADDLGMQLVLGEANNGYHVAWLSRLPVRRWVNHRLPALAKTLVEIEVPDADGGLHLFATHLASRHDGRAAVDELPSILDVLRDVGDEPHLLAGDLNALHPRDGVGDPPPGWVPRGDAASGAERPAIRTILDAGYVDCYRALHPRSPGYTYPTFHPWLRLDYMFVSPALARRLANCDVVRSAAAARASDHFPVWAEFRTDSARTD